MEQIDTISREELREKMERGDEFILLEVLGEASYDRGHLPGAIRFQDMSLAEEIIPDKDTEVVAYCSGLTWHSSTRVVRELTTMGYKHALEYEGGKSDWTDHGYPLESWRSALETYLHSFYTWALAKHGVRIGRAAGISGALGAAFPDLPSVAGTVYYVGPAYLRDGWSSMDTQEILDAIYFSGPFGGTGSALHSAVPPLLILSLYILPGLGRRDRKLVLLWFVIGWLGHTFIDFLTHVDDVRPLFWPLSDWTWSSPVSYYDSDYYGRTFSLLSNGLALLIAALLLIRRIRKRT